MLSASCRPLPKGIGEDPGSRSVAPELFGVADQVKAVNADVRSLPFADEQFDAVVSIDAFEYFGTDVRLLPTLLRVLRAGGRLGMSTPALRIDPYDGPVPEYVREVAEWEA